MPEFHEPLHVLPQREVTVEPQVKRNIEDLSHIEAAKKHLRTVTAQRSEARVALDADRNNRQKWLTFHDLDSEYDILINQLR